MKTLAFFLVYTPPFYVNRSYLMICFQIFDLYNKQCVQMSDFPK